jgi:hypothetical protein
MTKGSSGSRRWIRRRPIDTRPIVGMYEANSPDWLELLEQISPWTCGVLAVLTAAIAAAAWATDLFAGHLG